MIGISLRAYGRHRGVSEAAVRKAIKTGRITPLADGSIDAEVAAGRANSRAELIGRLLAREVRRQRALGDIEVMKRAGAAGYPDLEGVARATSRRRLDLD